MQNGFRAGYFLGTSLLVSLSLAAGCGDDGGGSDTDGDGLSDADEVTYGTSPILADTDGDGFSDGDEVHLFGFDSSINHYRFNPMIGDIPVLSVDIVTVPLITLRQETTTGSSMAFENSMGSSSSVATEKSKTNGFSVGVEAGTTSAAPHVVASAESQNSWTSGQVKDNTTTSESSTSYGATNEITSSSAELSIGVVLSNDTYVPFTIASATFSAVMSGRRDLFSPVGNLDFDTSTGNTFPETSLAPGASTGTIVYANRNLNLSVGQSILGDSTGLGVALAQSQLIDENGVPIAYDEALTGLRSALVNIDVGPAFANESYLTAVNSDPDASGRSLAEILDILAVPYVEGTVTWTHPDESVSNYNGLISLRDTTNNPEQFGRWVLALTSDDGLDKTTQLFDSALQGYALADIQVFASDIVTLVFLEDADVDSLGTRQEALLGTDPRLQDTDLDGFTDYQETQDSDDAAGNPSATWNVPFGDGGAGYTVSSHPLFADYDQDNLSDLEESLLRTDPYKADTDGDGDNDDVDDDPLRDPSNPNASLPKVGHLARFEQKAQEVIVSGAIVANIVGDTAVIAAIDIDWGDGTTPVALSPNVKSHVFSTVNPIAHTYAADGTYTASIVATDNQNPANVITKTFEITWTSPISLGEFTSGSGWLHGKFLRIPGDVNDDGMDDLIGFGENAVFVALANGAGFDAPTSWANDSAITYSALHGATDGVDPRWDVRRVADVNNDGSMDIVLFTSVGLYVGISNGSNQFTVSRWNTETALDDFQTVHELVDLDNDGDLDWVWFSPTGVQSFINDGVQFNQEATLTGMFCGDCTWSTTAHVRMIADMDNDGNPDIFAVDNFGSIWVVYGDGAGAFDFPQNMALPTSESIPEVSALNDTGKYLHYLVDVNGDDLLDVVKFGSAGVSTALNTTENGVFSLANPSLLAEFGEVAGGWRWVFSFVPGNFTALHFNRNPRVLADVNSDGFVDIVGFAESGVVVSLNNGTGLFSSSIVWTTDITTTNASTDQRGLGLVIGNIFPYTGTLGVDATWFSYRYAADVTGDGQADLISFKNNGVLVLPAIGIEEVLP